LRAHLSTLAGCLGRAAAPVGGTSKQDRISRAVVDVNKMCERCSRIREKAQRDPASHKVEFRAIVRIGRRR
jgi:hypothetical protein